MTRSSENRQSKSSTSYFLTVQNQQGLVLVSREFSSFGELLEAAKRALQAYPGATVDGTVGPRGLRVLPADEQQQLDQLM